MNGRRTVRLPDPRFVGLLNESAVRGRRQEEVSVEPLRPASQLRDMIARWSELDRRAQEAGGCYTSQESGLVVRYDRDLTRRVLRVLREDLREAERRERLYEGFPEGPRDAG